MTNIEIIKACGTPAAKHGSVFIASKPAACLSGLARQEQAGLKHTPGRPLKEGVTHEAGMRSLAVATQEETL